jgi:hypothetical protein
MTDKEILTQLVGLMEEMLEQDETQLQGAKILNHKIDLIWNFLPGIMALACLPDGFEKDASAQQLRLALEDPALQAAVKRNVARLESQHERRGALLAWLKEKIEGL